MQMTDTFESSDTEIRSTPSAGWDVEKLDHHTLLVEWKMAQTLGEGQAVSLQMERATTI